MGRQRRLARGLGVGVDYLLAMGVLHIDDTILVWSKIKMLQKCNVLTSSSSLSPLMSRSQSSSSPSWPSMACRQFRVLGVMLPAFAAGPWRPV
jgi:hypothetical protein